MILDSGTSYASINHNVNEDTLLCYGGGRVGIGTNTSPSYKLDVRDSRNANYIAYFENSSNSGDGIRIYAGNASDTSTKNLIEFRNNGGTYLGAIYYTTNGNLTYATFTGGHETDLSENVDTEIAIGSILKVVSASADPGEQPVYVCAPTNTPKDKKVIGVYGGYLDKQDKHSVLSLGDGHILVCSENGNIESGDYICSSTASGMGMKQDDDLLHNYTVAKATQDVDWSQESENYKLITCTYHCG